jgi:hypothetical protein
MTRIDPLRRSFSLLLPLVLGAACVPTDKGEDSAGAVDSGGADEDSGGGLTDDGGAGEGGDGGAPADCSGLATVIWLGESGDDARHPVVMAAAALGISSPRITDHEDELLEALAPGDVGLLIIDAPADTPDDETHAAIQALRDAGVPIIVSLTDLHREPEVWGGLFGVNGVDQWDERPIVPASGASVDLFAAPSAFPAPLDPQSSGWAINHHVLTMLGEGEVLATFDGAESAEAAIVRTGGGKVLFNGTFATNYQYVDQDGDDLNDGMELFINEISLMGSCGR